LLEIPRSRFAASIGYGTERIASVEAGRAPVRYEVFRAASKRYELSPQWLATGAGSPKSWGPFDDSAFAQNILPRALFTAVYDRFIAEQLTKQQEELAELENLHAKPPPHLRSELLEYCGKLEALAKEACNLAKEGHKYELLAKAIRRRLNPSGQKENTEYWTAVQALAKQIPRRLNVSDQEENNLLTGITRERKMAGVTEIQLLLMRLKRALEGMKRGDLARSLKVPLPRVSEWLSGRVMPSGETTLRLLRWVERQERQQNTLGSAMNTAKGKTQVRKSVL